jgi:hypothetical protein
MLGAPLRIGCIRAQSEVELGICWMHVDRSQRARVHEHEGAAIIEVEHRAREPRRGRAGLGEHPVAVHPEVRVENPTVLEVEQLVLAAALDAGDPSTRQCPKLRWRESTTQRGMQDAHAHDRAPTRTGA